MTREAPGLTTWTEHRATPAYPNRWLIAAAATVIQGAVGATYAWSVFRDPLAAQSGWTTSQTTLAYSLNVFGLGLFAFLGGLWMQRASARTIGLIAGLLYGLGLILAGLAGDRLWALYLGFGVVGGIGRGLGWVVSAATTVKWFPDRRGLIAGLSSAGNGLGAVVAAPLAAGLTGALGVQPTFVGLGAGLLVLVCGAALLLHEPPEGYCPPGWTATPRPALLAPAYEHTVGEALRTPQWYGLWVVLFVSSTAGLAIFSHAAPMASERTGLSAMAAAGVVGIMSAANAGGRLWWAWLSDLLGRRAVSLAMLVLLAAALRILPLTAGVVSFTLVAGTAMLCFGGGLSTMPAFAADFFGPKHIGPIVGLLMTAQGCAALVGPLLLATAHDTSGSYGAALSVFALAAALTAILPLTLRAPGPPWARLAAPSAAAGKVGRARLQTG